jgi:hypothetical protein
MFVVYVSVGKGHMDSFNMSLQGVHRVIRDKRVIDRAITLSDSAAGCVQQIKAGDACYNGSGGDEARCNGLVISLTDLCWYHAVKKFGQTVFDDEKLVNLDTLRRFIEEHGRTESARFFGATVTPAILVKMKRAIQRREDKKIEGVVAPMLSFSSTALMFGADCLV